MAPVVAEALGPLWRTVQLATLVSASTAVIGTGLAWLVVRSDLPGRRLLRPVVPLPLVFPSFVGAAALLTALGPGGLLRDVLGVVGLDAPDRFRGLGAAWLVLTLFTYPYVYLPVAARLATLSPSLEESARLLGSRPGAVFLRVVLPQLRASVLAGSLLTFLYTVSDFGAVQLLGYDTLTRVVFATALVDRARSFATATVLLALAVVVVSSERRFRGASVIDERARHRPARPVALGWWTLPALAAVGLVLGAALVGPLATLAEAAWAGLRRPDGIDLLSGLVDAAVTSATVSTIAAVVAVVVVLPVAVFTIRYRSPLAGVINAAVVAGFAVPGLVIALGLVFWTLNNPVVSRLYQTLPVLIVAYVVHFGSQAMRAGEVAVATVPERLRESARLLGVGPVRRFAAVELPLMRPGLTAGGGLVLLSTIKELPATLLLAPIGFQTLATRIWSSYEDGFQAEVGVASLALIALSGVLTWLLVLRRAVM